MRLGPCRVGAEQPPRVIVRVALADLANLDAKFQGLKAADTPVEGLLVSIGAPGDVEAVGRAVGRAALKPGFVVLEFDESIAPGDLPASGLSLVLLRRFGPGDSALLSQFAARVRSEGWYLACDILPEDLGPLAPVLQTIGDDRLIFTLSGRHAPPASDGRGAAHPPGAYRLLAAELDRLGLRSPVWIRNTAENAIRGDPTFLSKLIEASVLSGSLLCDGRGDLISVETEADPARSVRLAYNVLQGAGARISKTEFVACPSCGRTLFDLQTTTQRIRAQTGHLKGLKIAIMGCIVNGPGEMADADFGYVGGAPGKINLYVGRQCVQYNLPQDEADARLIALIKEHGKWAEPAGGAA